MRQDETAVPAPPEWHCYASPDEFDESESVGKPTNAGGADPS